MLPFMAALIFVGLMVTGLAIDAALLAATYREVAFAADVGAEAGAAELIRDGYGDRPLLDPNLARRTAIVAALDARPRAGRIAVASANDRIVCVTVTDRYDPHFLLGLGIAPETISVEACAEPHRG